MTPDQHTFEVMVITDGRFAVFVHGVRVAAHQLEVDAQEHSARLKLQASEQPDARDR
jgi:hypothetical protein